jgi:hypothetical protein
VIAAKTISAARPEDPILDWSALVEEGRASLEAMSDGGWTDFNAHDPGITILELVAYALTDFGYRAGHPIADLMAGSAPLPGPSESLTTRAVTLSDMRLVALDVAGVRNAWIETAAGPGVRMRHSPGARDLWIEGSHPEPTDKVALSGVHQVLIEKSSREDLTSAGLAQAVAARLHSQRNLGEDFDSFTVLEPQPVVVAADLELEDAAQADTVLLDIYGRLHSYMSPRPERTAVGELRRKGLSSEDIFDGPMLERGRVTGSGAEGRRRVLHLSDVIALLASTPGIRSTRRVRIGNTLAETSGRSIAWSLEIEEGRASAFDIQSSPILLLSGGAVALDSRERPDLARVFADTLRSAQDEPVAMTDDGPPAGRDRSVADYRPLRFDLPGAYGIRPGSLAASADSGRRAAANQLRAYLAIFDALLANLFAQLEGAKDLLSAGGWDGRSYFAQPAEQPSDEAAIVSKALDLGSLQAMVEESGGASAKARRGRFLAHLLARFGETAPAVPPVAIGFEGDSSPSDEVILRSRERFLLGFAKLSSGRGSGADLLVEGDESPLVERIRLKLGMPAATAGRLLLVEHILLRGIGDDMPDALPLLSAAARSDPYSLQVSFVLDERLKAARGDGDSIERVIREECPAHLVAYVRWLNADDFKAFSKKHARWMSALRSHRRELLGLGRP